MVQYAYGVIYFDGNRVRFNADPEEAYVSTDRDGKLPSYIAKEIIKTACDNLWCKDLKGGRKLLIVDDNGFIVKDNKIKVAKWNHVMSLDNDELPVL